MRVAIVGTGYVGLVTGVCLAEKGHIVTCVDVDVAKVESIRLGTSPIHEEGLEPLLRRHIGNHFFVTTSLQDAIEKSEVTFIAVGTPFNGREIDVSYVRRAAEEIGKALAHQNHYHLVVVKSTVIPGTTDNVVTPILTERSKKLVDQDFGVCVNPEFLTEGVAVKDFLEPDRIVLGGRDERAMETLAALYESFPNIPVIRTNNKTAELIKYTSNALLATMISFSNEMANLATSLGEVDAVDVMRAVHLSRYLTTQLPNGSSVTADIASFLYAGCGFGGSCLPKDVSALAAQGSAIGEPMRMLNAVLEVNRERPARTVAILRKHFLDLQEVRVAVLGLAFKPNTDDVRESPAMQIIDLLLQAGANVVAYDPVANHAAALVLPTERVRIAPDLEDAIENVDALVITTCWDAFVDIPELLTDLDRPPLVVDARRMLEKDSVQHYDGIGL